MIEPILQDVCYHDGRGPELQAVHYAVHGRKIRAIEYFNPDDVYSPENIKHLRFIKPQVFMFTPEEVYRPQSEENYGAKFPPAAIISLGKSPWLLSFSQQHLTKCNHFQIMFYDEYLDIICEDIVFGQGTYQSPADFC